MIILAVILGLLLCALASYGVFEYMKAARYEYKPPFVSKDILRCKLARSNPALLARLSNPDDIDKLLRFKISSFYNLFLLGMQQNKEYKPSFYEDMTEAVSSYISFWLLHVELSKRAGSVINWPLLEHSLRDMETRVEEAKPVLASKLANKPGSKLYKRQTDLFAAFRDLSLLKGLLYH